MAAARLLGAVLSLGVLAGVRAGTCGTCGQCPDAADCDHVDFAGCGNACCRLSYASSLSSAAAAAALNDTILAGGPDGAYTAQPLYEGVTGFADLRPFNVSRDFIGQAYHMTSGDAHFNDTINMNTVASGSGSVVEFTSISLIGGALGDAGQNYKNIANLAKAVFGDDIELAHMDDSCPAPARR
mmetsp:Transcript_1126/g.3368  ORF Transcript_1126/g.3368 Transcript_1126/m.3368 type:complete len:184 (-) Transcript_1126:43-594(-)